MPVIRISGPAHAFAGSPRAKKPIADRKDLLRFHGLVSTSACSDFFDEEPLQSIGLSGGRLRFVLDDSEPVLRITTSYQTPRRLTDEEIDRLREETQVQWSDGCGNGCFENCHGEILSTSLAMAIDNGQGHDIGEYFVDAYPIGSKKKTVVEFLESDEAEIDCLVFVKQAAEWGDPQAQFTLARHFESGEGVEQSAPLAFQYYEKAADQGHGLALTHLGLCHQRGTGTEVDLIRAFECFHKAAEANVALGMHCLGYCYEEGRGVAQDFTQAINWYQRGVELGDVGCTAQLAECYEKGNGVAQDLPKSLELYERCLVEEHWIEVIEPAIERVKKLMGDG